MLIILPTIYSFQHCHKIYLISLPIIATLFFFIISGIEKHGLNLAIVYFIDVHTSEMHA